MADLPTGTVTFLFTDIEGSTRLWEQHPQAMAARARPPRRDLRQAIAADGGRGLQDHRRCLPGRVRHRAGGLRRRAGGPARAGRRSVGRDRRGAGAHGAAHRRGRADAMATTSRRRAQPRRALAGRGARRPDPALAQHRRAGARARLPPDVTLRDLGEHRLRDLPPRADLPARRARPAGRLPAAQDARSPPAQPAGAADRADRARARGRGRLRAAAARRRAAADADRPGRHRQDPPGAPGRRRAARRLRATASASSTWRRSAIPTWSPPTIAQALGVQESGGQPLLERLQGLPARASSCCCCWTTSSRCSTRRRWSPSCWRLRRS